MKLIGAGDLAGTTSICWFILTFFINSSYISNFKLFVNHAAESTNTPAQIEATEKSLVCI
jgi:hypothetical protein